MMMNDNEINKTPTNVSMHCFVCRVLYVQIKGNPPLNPGQTEVVMILHISASCARKSHNKTNTQCSWLH